MSVPSDLDRLVQSAIARLETNVSYRLQCQACGHEAAIKDDPGKSIYKCDECGAMTCFGAEQPRVAVAPHADRRFVVLTVTQGQGARKNEIQLTFERQYAAAIALEVLSLVEPGRYAAFMRMLAAGRDVPGAPRAEEQDDGVTLDAPLPGHPVGRPQRVPGPAPAEEAPNRCQCGAPSEMTNGACRVCFARALGIGDEP